MNAVRLVLLALTAAFAACSGRGTEVARAAGLHVADGLHIQVIARLPAGVRELAFAPNGDLFAGTSGDAVYLVPNADGPGAAGRVVRFAAFGSEPAAGIGFGPGALYVGTQFVVYRIPYTSGDRNARSQSDIAHVRAQDDNGDDNHTSTSVAFTGGTLYASIGSTCDACRESNPVRATIQQMRPDGTQMRAKAVRFRNAIALAVNPATGSLWAGGAGQDAIAAGHPYEFLDNVSAHAGIADYGWPDCEENHHAYRAGADCRRTVEPQIVFPAYATLIGAAFYAVKPRGSYALPMRYAGGVFVTMHGSWHRKKGCTVVPLVAFVPMRGDLPVRPVDWNDPTTQWNAFITGFQPGCSAGTRIGRPTGIAVGPQGDLFVGDDQTGYIYRIRP